MFLTTNRKITTLRTSSTKGLFFNRIRNQLAFGFELITFDLKGHFFYNKVQADVIKCQPPGVYPQFYVFNPGLLRFIIARFLKCVIEADFCANPKKMFLTLIITPTLKGLQNFKPLVLFNVSDLRGNIIC